MKTKMNRASNNKPEIIHDGNNTVKLKGKVEEMFVSVFTEDSMVDPKLILGSGLGATLIFGASLRFNALLQ